MARVLVFLPLLSISLSLAQLCAAQTPAIPTLKANTKIVVIDVVVTDKQGDPVKNLKASDFSLTENTTPQTITHFDAHTSLSAEDAAKLPPMPKLPENVFTNYSPAPANGPLTVLLFDSLNTRDKIGFLSKSSFMMDQSNVEKNVLKYLAIPHPGLRMELFEMNDGLRLLHGFTTDPDALRTQLLNRKKCPQSTIGIPNPLCGSDDTISTDWTNPPKPSDDDGKEMAHFAERAAAAECREQELRVRSVSTLQQMAALARYMGGLPGRKNLLWFSTSFVIPSNKRDVSDELHRTMALFAKNQVAVYPIGAGGLMLAPPRLLGNIDSQNLTSDMIADETGGKAFRNSNDIAAEVGKAVDHGSNYYTLTYTPANRDWKGEFRRVQVKLAQKGYSLAYRPGYYADDLDKAEHKDAVATVETVPLDQSTIALNSAMEYGSPQPSDVILKVAVNPATGQPENTVAKLNIISSKVSAPFERYVLSVAALPAAFTFTRDIPGKIHMAARLVTRVYTADGTLTNKTTLNAIGDIDDARYQTIMAEGLQFKQEISVPVKGESFLRIGVEDLATNRVGVVEIPVATVANLKPLEPANAALK